MAWMSQAAVLDELMGRNRNVGPMEEVKEPHWSDPDMCRYYLCAFCPHELFVNTKSDMGPCRNAHEEKMRDAYLKSSRRGKMGYEEEFVHLIQSLVDDCDRRIIRGHDRLKGGNIMVAEHHAKIGTIDIIKQDKIDSITKRIEELLSQAETLGGEGKVDQAQAVMKLCDQLKFDKSVLEGENRPVMPTGKELEVCEICAAFRIKDDAPQRVEEHLAGKMHIGYAKIRDYLRDWNEKLASSSRNRSSRSKSSSIRYNRDRKSSDRDRSRSRSRSSKRDRKDREDRDRNSGSSSKHRHHHDRKEKRSKRKNSSPFSSGRKNFDDY